MFEQLSMAPADPILGLTEAFKRDPNPNKVNLSVGVYKDASGQTPIFRAVKRAEERLLSMEKTKSYLGIPGTEEFARLTQELIFGADHPIVTEQRACTAHTPGGTGALRVAGDFVFRMVGAKTVWVSQPTWPNHPGVFQAAGHQVKTYPYFDPETHGLAFDRMIEAWQQIPEGDLVVIHGCCHNPTGADPTPEQWRIMAQVLAERHLVPLIDLAYQGLADGLQEDVFGVRAICDAIPECFIASSYSKNFGLYNERVGALTLVASNASAAAAAFSHLQLVIRTNYSNPPAHGELIVNTVLSDPELRADWEAEVAEMRDRINGMRRLFVETLKAKGVERDFSFVMRQRGMFSYSGLTPDQVQTLREKYSIYIVNSGRINVAGMTPDNMDRICQAIAEVIAA
ncbi:MAG: aspartate transaminase [Anaerolineae bacterium]